MLDIDDLLMQIEEEVLHGKKAIFGGGVTVNGDRVLAVIEKIKDNLPDVIKEAKYIVSSREKRHIEDLNRGKNIIMQAQQRADEMLNEHNIIEAAAQEAEEIKKQANEYQNRRLAEVRHALYDLFEDAEKHILKALHEVSSFKEEI
jgi:hypothetical protein